MGPRPALFLVSAGLALAGPASAQETPAETDATRQLFQSEVCAVDELTAAQCQCAWAFVQEKLSPRDLRTAMLILASNSDDEALAEKSFNSLERANVPDRRRDELAGEISALTVDAMDACP